MRDNKMKPLRLLSVFALACMLSFSDTAPLWKPVCKSQLIDEVLDQYVLWSPKKIKKP